MKSTTNEANQANNAPVAENDQKSKLRIKNQDLERRDLSPKSQLISPDKNLTVSSGHPNDISSISKNLYHFSNNFSEDLEVAKVNRSDMID